MQVFSMEALLWTLPLFDNLYLSMQGQNVMLVDFHLRDLEASLLAEYHQRERTPFPAVLFVSALSQMWIFATYELLRTWRQFIRDLKKAAAGPPDENEPDGEDSARRQLAEAYWRHHVEQLRSDPRFGEQLEAAHTAVDPLFRKIESLRMNLAKHEVPKRPGELALAPGYGRIDESDGSICWFVDLGDNCVDTVSRRANRDHLRCIVIGHALREEPDESVDPQGV
jgi:hypothetical protein